MKKQLLLSLLFGFSISIAIAQQSVSIGDTQVKSNAVLYLKGNGSQGLIIPVVTATGTFGEQGMIVYNSTDKKLYYNNGTAWVESGGAGSVEIDGIVGNELSDVNTARGGLERTGSGTSASPYNVGLIQGTIDGQILKWNNSTKKWELGTAAVGTVYTAGTGISITGASIANTGDTNAADDITTASTGTGDVTGTFPNLTVSKIRGVNVVATAPTTNQVLQYNGTNWSPATLAAGTTYTAGTGISITGSSIANTGDTNGADDITTASTGTGDVTGTFPSLTVSKIRGVDVVVTAPTTNQVLQYNGTNWTPATLATSGTVSSVGLTMPSIFAVSGSPVTTSGTLNATLSSQTAATIFAAPTAAAGVPTFRTLAATDIPDLDATKITTGNLLLARLTGAGAGVKAILGSDNNNVSWVTGGTNQLLGTDAAGALSFSNKSNFSFTTANVIPKGSSGGLVASQIFDDGFNVGIGIATPSHRLTLYNATSYSLINFQSATTGITSGDGFMVGLDNASGDADIWNWEPGMSIRFATSGSQRMIIDGTGKVGIGTSTPSTTLEVNGFTKLGSDAPSIKVKKIIGTTASTEGGSTPPIATGIAGSKIISVTVMVEYFTDNYIEQGYTNNPGYQFNWYGGSLITVWNTSGNSFSILSKPIKILVTYEE